MRTMLRLQNHGCKNHPFWWIVAQGSYTNLRGRFVEHVGYYLPRRTKTVQRAVIFNKPRIRYWLAMGATPSRAVHRVLSYIDFMPKVKPTFGFKQMYEKPVKPNPTPQNLEKLSLGKKLGKFYDDIKERRDLGLLERELKSHAEIHKQIKLHENPELIDSDIEDIKDRTRAFNSLREHFLELEKDVTRLNIRKREIVFRKMNKLAEQGILSNEGMKPQLDAEKGEQGFFGTTIKERLDKQMKFQKLLELKKKHYESSKHDIEMLKPISQEDFVNYIYDRTKTNLTKIKEEAENIYTMAGATGRYVTRQEAWELTQNFIQPNTHHAYAKTIDGNSHFVFPQSVTPFPDLITFDPTSYYDTKLVPDQFDNPNKGYESVVHRPRHVPVKAWKYRLKQVTGRKRPPRVNFSTFNKGEDIVVTAQTDLTNAYTDMFSRIGKALVNGEI